MTEERETPSGQEGPASALSLGSVKILSSVPEEERRYLETRCSFRRIAAGAVLLERFSLGSSTYFITEGRARIVHRLEDGDEFTIATVARGDALGEISAIDGGTSSATVVAEEDCTVAELPKEEFQALIVRRGEVALSLLKRWAGIIRDLDDKVTRVSRIGPEQRIYSEIIRLARVEKPGGDRWIVPELPSHQDLAVRTQTSREAVASAIADLYSRGIAERRTRSLAIRDYKALKDMVRQGKALPAPNARAGNA
ncbi:MAG TPA: Crp/Fnr family transcriptional regulator [Stellaceae bacterium]|nr:Crp/Fnr family transcriptional regulator [Stellaceae bacterium]